MWLCQNWSLSSKKGMSEELRIVVNDIRERCEKVQAEFEANFDRNEEKYVILADEFRAYFRKKGFVPQHTQDAKDSIDYMDNVMKKIREINRRNNILKKKNIRVMSVLFVFTSGLRRKIKNVNSRLFLHTNMK